MIRGALGHAALLMIAGLAGCGDPPSPQIALDAYFRWREAPAAVGEIGYEVNTVIRWLSDEGCEPPSARLRVTVNGREAETDWLVVECDRYAAYQVGGIADEGPVTIRLFGGDQVLGEAMYEGAFPGLAARLVSPADGRVTPGGDIAVTLPAGFPPPHLAGAQFHWRQTPAEAPPFFSYAPAEIGEDGGTLTMKAPSGPGLTGPAALVVNTGSPWSSATATRCTHFAWCGSTVDPTVGPVEVEVVAAP